MENKIRVVLSAVWYPMCIARYFLSAFERDERFEVKIVGPFTGSWIPWNGGMHLDDRYVRTPDISLPKSFIGNVRCNSKVIETQLEWDKVDLWVNLDSTFCVTRPSIADHVVTVAIDPHVLDYSYQRTQCDVFYNMQPNYMQGDDRLLLYAASEEFHYPEEVEKVWDACLIGLPYPNRVRLVNRLRRMGYNVFFNLGYVYDEYRKICNQSKVIINWSSKQDIIARVFEAMAMRLPLVTNRVANLENFFDDGTHLYMFDDVESAIAQISMVLSNYDDAMKVAQNGYNEVTKKHLYKYRINTIVRNAGLE